MDGSSQGTEGSQGKFRVERLKLKVSLRVQGSKFKEFKDNGKAV